MIDYRFTLELTDDSVQKRITVHQGEVNSRRLIINFSEHGKPFDLSPYSVVAFRAITAKRNKLFNDCTVAGNCIEYIMTSDTVADAGLAEAQIDIYGSGDNVLYSPRFNYYVTEALYSDTIIEGKDEFSALQKLLTNTSELYESLGSLQEVSAAVEQDATQAEAAKESAETSAERAETGALEAKKAQSAAENSERNAADYAKTAETCASTATEAAISATQEALNAKMHADGAENSANYASQYYVEARNAAEEAARSAERLATISDEELIIYPTIYNNDAPDWTEHDASNVDPYILGKDLYFKADIKQGKTYLVRVFMEIEEGFPGPEIMLTKKNSGDTADRIDDYKFAVYNEAAGCYQAEFTAKRSTEKGEELMLFVGYPNAGSPGYDFSATFGGARILLKDSLRGVIDSQNEEITQIGGDIETALDGIIAIQNKLMGGGSV